MAIDLFTGGLINPLSREYETVRAQLFQLAQVYSPDWTDLSSADPGAALLELLAGLADQQHYYLDFAVGECHWSTAQLPQSISDMASLIGYTPSTGAAASVNLSVVTNAAVVLAGVDSLTETPFRVASAADGSRGSYSFELLESVSVPGAGTSTLVFVEGTTVFRELVAVSSGAADQQYRLRDSPVVASLDGAPSIRVESPLGTTWTRVESFIDSTATDRHYTTRARADGSVLISFGDGTNGAKPGTGVEIRATYRVGGGTAPNEIAPGKITQISTANAAVVSVSNPARPSGGQGPETVEEIRTRAPLRWATQDRVISAEDFSATARAVPGVWKARSARFRGRALTQGVWVATYGSSPVPSGDWDFAAQAGTGLLGAVGRAIVPKLASCMRVEILPVTAVQVNVALVLTLESTTYRSIAESAALAVVNRWVRGDAYAELPSVLALSVLYAALMGVSGVVRADVTLARRTPYVEGVRVGYANTTWTATSRGNSSTEEWAVVFTSATTFEVEGGASGPQNNTGTVGTLWTADGGTLQLQATAGSRANQAGDRYRILTGGTTDNIQLQDHEAPVLGATQISLQGGV